MDPTCLITPVSAIDLMTTRGNDNEELEGFANSLNVSITCPQLDLDFFVPKVDMRKPTDIPTAEFVSLFWMRKVHPELFQMRLRQFEMVLCQDSGGSKSPMSITFSADFMDILFQETEASDKIPLAVVRKSQRNSTRPEKVAVKISLTVCMDESQKLQGRFDSDSAAFKGQQKGSSSFSNFEHSEQFFGKAAGVSGDVRSGSSRGHKIVGEKGHIKAALEHSLIHHNILVDLVLDEVSLVLPNKHVYEVIYNRLGNDMLLWLPAIFSVKDVLYNQPLPDPLRDPDQEFSHCLSGLTTAKSLAIENRLAEEEEEDEEVMNRSIYQSFPKTGSKSGGLRIHTDTCVSLKLNKGHVCIASSSPSNDVFFFVGVIDKLKLLTAVGLERDPEICLLSLNVQDAKMYFGPADANVVHDCNSHDFAARCHFNEFPSPKVMPLFRSSTFKSRVWPNSFHNQEQELLELTTKILFDSRNNFKSITLALFLCEGSIVASTPEALLQPVLADWLAEFFTVVEYPVLGYIPPAILTEMYFDLKHCTLDLTYLSPGQITFSLGHVKITCCLIDTGNDLNITIAAEDLGLFLSKNETAVSHLKSSICVLDIDSFDISVELRETKQTEHNVLDVNAAVQLLRLRTCNDTLVLLASLMASLSSSSAASDCNSVSSREASVSKEMETDAYEQQQMPEDVVPDIADAMAELEASEDDTNKETVDDDSSNKKGKSKMAKTKGGAQVFFFPDENQKVLEQFGMSDSIYLASHPHSSDNAATEDHDFCILDDIGSAYGSKPSQPTVKLLNSSQSVSLIENHFAMTKEKSNLQIDYLKTPKGFPKFQSRITLKNISLLWQIFGGQDFSAVTQGSINQQQPRAAAAGFNQNTTEALKTRGGPNRQESQLLEVFLSKVSAQHEVYAGESSRLEASRQILLIKSFEIRDKLENSDINKLLHLYSNKLRPRQSNANMFSLKCINLRPDPDMPTAEESVVNITLQPLRVNIDQETLFFIVNFCTAFVPDPEAASTIAPHQQASSSHVNTIRYDHTLDSVEIQEVAQEAFEGHDNFATTEEEASNEVHTAAAAAAAVHGARRDGDLYIRSFTFARDVPIRIDYSAKYMDLAHGAIPGILAGLTSLNCSELTLKKVHYKNGISGVDKLLTLLITDWLADIRQNQIPAILGGVGPMHSFLQLVQGVKDLFIMPVEQYNKDGRILRGIQKGAHSFTSLTAMSLLDFTNKLLGVIKFAAEMAFDIMSPETSVVQGKLPHPHINRHQTAAAHMRRRPADMREGMFNAFAVIQEGMEETARTVIQNVIDDHNRRGLTGAVGGIIRQVPSNLVRPVIVATAATSNVLEGVKNQVAPDARQEEEEKWKNT